MLKFIAMTIVTLTIAIGGGAGSMWLAMESEFGFGLVRIGEWVSAPARGTPKADPYARARFSREADLALGEAEGIVFSARRDAAGEPLLLECQYRVAGGLPPARFWTLHARDEAGRVIKVAGDRPAGLHSLSMLRESDSTVVTTVARHAAPGNWLAVEGQGPLTLVLTLYDTATASNARIAEVDLPRIIRTGCDD